MQREKNLWLKLLSMILTLALLISCVPNQVYAISGDALSAALQQNKDTESTEEIDQAERGVYEVAELREENVKHFALKDGAYTAVVYGAPVHTLDADGSWQDIDNRLSESGSEFSTSNARIKFAKKITGNEVLFTLYDGNRKITMSLDNAIKKTTGTVTNHTTEFDSKATQLQKLMTLDNLSSEILYADILDAVDLQYVVESVNIKENIIVKEKKDSYQYTFTISLNNLAAVLQEDGSVKIYDPDTLETVYNIPAGFMYDANGEYSTAVAYTLTDNGNGKYSMAVIADAEWINAEERAFPVVIDPTITTKETYNIMSTSIHEDMPNAKGTDIPFLAAGPLGIAYWRVCELPTLPNGTYISDATLNLHAYRSNLQYPNTLTTMTLGAYAVTTDWHATTMCYSLYSESGHGQYSATAIDAQTGADENGDYSFDITQCVQSWYNNPATNFGIAITATEAESLLYDPLYRFTCDIEGVPLTITYANCSGLENYWSYSTQTAGSAGTGYINNATGTLSFAIPTLTTTDSLFSYTPTLMYNQDYAGEYITSTNSYSVHRNTMYGYGFSSNMCETIASCTYGVLGNSIGYIWTDADGTEHLFTSETVDDKVVYTDTDGLLLTLEEFDTYYTISDANHNVRTFNKTTNISIWGVGGILSHITDKSGNELKFVYNTQGKISSLQITPNNSAAITYFTFSYNAYGLLNTITNSVAKQTVRFHYSPNAASGTPATGSYGYLRKVVWTEDNTTVAEANYTYDTNGYLSTAYDAYSSYEIRYSYSNSTISSVIESAGVTSEEGQQISFAYGDSYSEIRNSGSDDLYGNADDIITTIVFDKYGRVSSSYSTDVSRTKIYGASSGEYETQEKAKNNVKYSVLLAVRQVTIW